MLTKYYLEIDGIKHEIPTRCIKNWDEVLCAYKRTDYSSVTRSFTSQFEFVHEAYEMLLNLYLRDGFKAVAKLSLYTITDRWEWEERFSAPIDFSSITWDKYILRVNCVDSSLAAMIKANKGTKYEFEVGTDIETSTPMLYDRVPMIDIIGYQVMGETQEESSAMKLTIAGGVGRVYRVPTYLVNEEISVNGSIAYGDQTDDADSYLLKAEKDVTVTIRGGIALDRVNILKGSNFGINVYHTSEAGTKEVLVLAAQSWLIGYNGEVNTPADLPESSWVPGQTMLVNSTNTIWELWVKEDLLPESDEYPFFWRDTHLSFDEFMNEIRENEATVDLKAGDILWIGADANPGLGTSYSGDYWVYILNQKIEISWRGLGENESIDTIKPIALCQKILDRICGDKLVVNPVFSGYDSRFANTYILAAESIRKIPGAKIYSSFTEFCDWMQTVFGYTYYLGEPQKSRYVGIEPFFTHWSLGNEEITDEVCPAEYTKVNQLVFLRELGVFAVMHDRDWKFCTRWEKSATCEDDTAYNDRATGKARLDKVFVDVNSEAFYVDADYQIKSYDGKVDKCTLDCQEVHFIHRSELFRSNAEVRKIRNSREVTYSVDSSSIYATIIVGYEKQDYEGFNGRDEFNFNNTYSTGFAINDKKLSLISKYRADCYGIEFAVQLRGKDTTDDSSDQDVFFVLAKTEYGGLVPDRTIPIKNTITDRVFNGAFSPMSCVLANAGYIGKQANRLHLEFASSTGNSNIVIGSHAVSDDIDISERLMTCGKLSFITDETDEMANVNDLVEVESDGIIYRGFVEQATFKFANNEAVKYQLHIKEIVL